MLKRVLVPLDGSVQAESICGWVLGLARNLEMGIELLMVVDPKRFAPPYNGRAPSSHASPIGDAPRTLPAALAGEKPLLMSGSQIPIRTIEWARRYLRHRAMLFKASGLKVTGGVAVGEPAEEILTRAEEGEVDMIAMATRRDFQLARVLLGSVTSRVLGSAHVPLLTIHPHDLPDILGNLGQPERIVVPLDGSPLSEEAVPTALSLAEPSGAEWLFLRALEPPYPAVGPSGVRWYPPDLALGVARKKAIYYLSRFVERARSKGLTATGRALAGSARFHINKTAEEQPNTLVVMTARGASVYHRWSPSRVVQEVVRTCRRPVLVLPPPRADRRREGEEAHSREISPVGANA